jgi:uncharacterized protein YecE (DUF72 family)
VNTSGNIRIGISRWRYKGWRGVFYPKRLPQRRELEYAARKFPSAEINGTFYAQALIKRLNEILNRDTAPLSRNGLRGFGENAVSPR